MNNKLKTVIEDNIDYIDKKDYASLFFNTIQTDEMLFNSNLTEELYEVLVDIGITDTDILWSPSNNTEVIHELMDAFKTKGYPDIKPLAGFMICDGGNRTYYDLIALVKHNDHVFKKYVSLTCGEDENLRTEAQVFNTFINSIIREVKGY